MPLLKDLPGCSGDIEATFFQYPSAIWDILDMGYAAIAAGNNGAMHVYYDDDGDIRVMVKQYPFPQPIVDKTFDPVDADEVQDFIEHQLEQIR